jgi:TPR repeat protein
MTEQNTLSISELQQQANAGDAQAQYDLALYYAECEHFDLALEWFSKAAEQGFAEAQYELAMGYFHSGNPKFAEWLKKAAAQGHVEAIAKLKASKDPNFYEQIAISYLMGENGFERNATLAFKWFFHAAVHGSAIGNFMVAEYIRSGRAVGCDEKGEVIENGRDEVVFKHLKKADKLFGNINEYELLKKLTNNLLAECYEKGKGVQQNRELAQFHRQLGIDESDMKKIDDSYLELPPQLVKESLDVILATHFENNNTDLADKLIERALKDSTGSEQVLKKVSLLASKEIAKKNQELEEKNKELNNLVAMFAHNFLGTLQCIRSNAEHENNPNIHLKTVKMMGGALTAFSILSADDDKLVEQLKQDNAGETSLQQSLANNLALAISQLLGKTNKDKIVNLYLYYLRKTQQIESDITSEELRANRDYRKKWQALQHQWEDEFNALFSEKADLPVLQKWITDNFFSVQITGFDSYNISFKEHGITDSIFLIVFMEVFVNAFKYMDVSKNEALTLKLCEEDLCYKLICENPSSQETGRGTHKGMDFLKTIAKKLGGQFMTEVTGNSFKSTFAIPSELLK